MSFVLTLEEVKCGITREQTNPRVFLNHIFYFLNLLLLLTLGEGQQWNRARRINPKSRAHWLAENLSEEAAEQARSLVEAHTSAGQMLEERMNRGSGPGSARHVHTSFISESRL